MGKLFEYLKLYEDVENEVQRNSLVPDNQTGYSRLNRRRFASTLSNVFRLKQQFGYKRLLEIGPYKGFTPVAYRKLGFDVTIVDVPEYTEMEFLKHTWEYYGIESYGCNLNSGRLPFSDEAFDIIVCCETIEHFNFNPIPAVREMHRLLGCGGGVYITVPNQAYIRNRLKLLVGLSVSPPIQYFFANLDPSDDMKFGLHWKEYTMAELTELFERCDFEIIEKCFFTFYLNRSGSLLKKTLQRSMRLMTRLAPQFGNSLYIFARKVY